MKVCVLGSGGWGTALSLVLLENGHDVTLWSFLEEEYQTLAQQRENPMLKGVKLPETLKLTYDMNCAADCDVVVLATPSFAVRTTAGKLAHVVKEGTVLVSVSKGIEAGTSKRLSQGIEEETAGKCPVVVLCGPTHAEEVGRGVPSAIVAASRNQAAAELVQQLFMNERFRVYTSDDVVGAEIGAALKNVIALCAGISDGMGFGDNTRAMLMTRGLTEIARLGIALGGKQATFAGLTGVGDLIVTCTSMHSRNHRAGILIGQGMEPEAAVKEIGAVVEGFYAAKTARELAHRCGVEMPITEAAYAILYEGMTPRDALAKLMNRNGKPESEDAAWV
jgi:glycerol-3-phosphate dehydrogenase (NAD(P)+)